MNIADLTPVKPSNFPFFFPEPPQSPQKKLYKIYNAGGHYVASLFGLKSGRTCKKKTAKNIEMDMLFDNLYFNALTSGFKGYEMTEYIKGGILKLFPTVADLDGYIEHKIECKGHNLYARKKLFRRKANLNHWNYFVTITYSDKLHDENTFRKKLRKCLSNLHTRRKWRYMGVFERAPETNRLHFHGIIYVPNDDMIGQLTEISDFDIFSGQMQTTVSNSFFVKNFGRNDFKEINKMELRNGNSIAYLLKYIGKTNERIVYSRGIPSHICKELTDSDIATEMLDFVAKFVLFDDVIDWERDISKYRSQKQMTFIDLYCNPPHII